MFDFFLQLLPNAGYLGTMLSALKITLGIAVSSLLCGLILAFVFVTLESSRWKIIRLTCTAWVTIIRSLPEILVVFIIALGLPYLGFIITGDYPNFPLFWLGVGALSLIYAAYASQTIRGALSAIPIGQWESGYVLGFPRWQVFIQLIMPQMWRHALPGLGNQWLVLLKDTALVSLIGLHDIMFVAESAFAVTQKPFTWYSIAALLYLSISVLSQYGQNKLMQYVTRYENT